VGEEVLAVQLREENEIVRACQIQPYEQMHSWPFVLRNDSFFLAAAAAAHASTRKRTIAGSARSQVNTDCKNTRTLFSFHYLIKTSFDLAFRL
jgi:hypothetical protein